MKLHPSYRILGLGLLTMLTACASSPPQYFTLQNPAVINAPLTHSRIAVEFLPVIVPEQIDQPQLMLRTGPQELTPNYKTLWAASLGQEVRTGLASTLYQQRGITDLTGMTAGHDGPLWRLQVKVQVFEMPLSGPVTLETLWRARRVNSLEAFNCQTRLQVTPKGSDIPALVGAQREAVAALAGQIASALNAAPHAEVAGCVRDVSQSTAAKTMALSSTGVENDPTKVD